MAVFALLCVLVVLAFAALLVAMTALDRTNETYAYLENLEAELSELRKHVRRLRREDAGYPPEPVVAHRWADVYDFLPRSQNPSLTDDRKIG